MEKNGNTLGEINISAPWESNLYEATAGDVFFAEVCVGSNTSFETYFELNGKRINVLQVSNGNSDGTLCGDFSTEISADSRGYE